MHDFHLNDVEMVLSPKYMCQNCATWHRPMFGLQTTKSRQLPIKQYKAR